MILSSAAADGVLVDRTEPRRRFARVENAGMSSRDGLHKLPREGSDATHTLQKIQDHTLAGTDHARIVTDDGDRLARPEPNSMENLRMRCDFIVRSDCAVESGINIKNACHYPNASEDAFLLRNDGSRGALIGIDARIAGSITRRLVFEQRILENRCKPS